MSNSWTGQVPSPAHRCGRPCLVCCRTLVGNHCCTQSLPYQPCQGTDRTSFELSSFRAFELSNLMSENINGTFEFFSKFLEFLSQQTNDLLKIAENTNKLVIIQVLSKSTLKGWTLLFAQSLLIYDFSQKEIAI